MSIITVEGFETVGDTTGSGEAANVKARLGLRYTVAGTLYLKDDYLTEGFCCSINAYNSTIREVFPTPVAGNTYVCGARFHQPDTSVRDFYIFQPKESLAHFFGVVVRNGTDLIVVRQTGAVLGTAAGVITPGGWHYIECKWLVDGTVGIAEVWLDGAQVLDLSGLNTSYFGTTVYGVTWGGQSVSGPGPSGTGDDWSAIDDIWLAEVDGTTPNDFLGSSVRIESLPPMGDDTVQWTPSAAVDHYTLVDENPADSADNVYTSTDTEVEMFDMTDSTEAKNIYAVKVEVEAIDDIDAGANNIDVRIDSGGTVSETNHNVTNTGAYAVFTHLEGEINPDTSTPWTKTTINACKIGIQYNT